METYITVKTKKALKVNAKRVAFSLGISLDDIINESLRQLVKNRKVVFSKMPYMTPELEKIIGQAENDLVSKRNTSRTFFSARDAIKYLHS